MTEINDIPPSTQLTDATATQVVESGGSGGSTDTPIEPGELGPATAKAGTGDATATSTTGGTDGTTGGTDGAKVATGLGLSDTVEASSQRQAETLPSTQLNDATAAQAIDRSSGKSR
jgi:hypothetical protein